PVPGDTVPLLKVSLCDLLLQLAPASADPGANGFGDGPNHAASAIAPASPADATTRTEARKDQPATRPAPTPGTYRSRPRGSLPPTPRAHPYFRRGNKPTAMVYTR